MQKKSLNKLFPERNEPFPTEQAETVAVTWERLSNAGAMGGQSSKNATGTGTLLG